VRKSLAVTVGVIRSATGLLIGVGLVSALGVSGGTFDPLALYTPPGFFSPGTRARVGAGAAVVDVLPAHGRDLAVFGMARIEADGDRLVAWTRRIEDFQRGPHMVRALRFSDPPRLEDLDSLVLESGDLDDIRRCRPGDCGLKLGAAEITQLRRTISVSGTDWRQAVQRQFRQIMVDRAIAYLANGYAGLPVYNDHATPIAAGTEFDAVAARVRDRRLHEARLMHYLQDYPWNDRADPDIESFLYWSKESLGSGKPIVSITHVAVLRGREPLRPDAIVASKQVFATHYLLASLSLMAMTHPTANGDRYLLYTRQSRVDVFEGALAGLRRRLVEKRIRSAAPGVLDAARRRLESGEPPPDAVSTP